MIKMGRNIFSFAIVKKDGTERYFLEEIAREEREKKEYLGKAFGRDVGHCAHMAYKYCEDFLEKARWYFINHEVDPKLEEFRRE